MKKKLPVIFFLVFFITANLSAGPNHGPVIKTFLAPYGSGYYTVPHESAKNVGDRSLTSDSSGGASSWYNSLRGYTVSCGYFYDWFQGDVSYTDMKTENRYVIKASTPENQYYSDAELRDADIRGGYRFNDPGDTSYTWLYIGIKKTNMAIPYKRTKVDALGFFAGLYGFSSAGFYSPFEIVLTYDVYAGTCRRDQNHLSSEVDIDLNHRYAVDLGLSAGIGVQYEPWDIAIILKVSSFITDKTYRGTYNGNSAKTSASLTGTVIGIEFVLSIPDYKNNIIE